MKKETKKETKKLFNFSPVVILLVIVFVAMLTCIIVLSTQKKNLKSELESVSATLEIKEKELNEINSRFDSITSILTNKNTK